MFWMLQKVHLQDPQGYLSRRRQGHRPAPLHCGEKVIRHLKDFAPPEEETL